jgi:hypothetical protein
MIIAKRCPHQQGYIRQSLEGSREAKTDSPVLLPELRELVITPSRPHSLIIMATKLSIKGDAVKLVFDPRVRIPGESLDGIVEIDFPQARADGIDSVEVKLLGFASTCVYLFNERA